MKKTFKVFTTMLLLLVFTSEVFAQSGEITIKGELKGLKFGELIISENNLGKPGKTIAKCKIENTKVNLKTKIEYPFNAIVQIKGTDYVSYPILEPNQNYGIMIRGQGMWVTGGLANELKMKNGDLLNELLSKDMNLYNRVHQAVVSENEKDIKDAMEEYHVHLRDKIKKVVQKIYTAHPNNISSMETAMRYSRELDYNTMLALYNLSNDYAKSMPTAKRLKEIIDGKRKGRIGATVENFALADKTGTKIDFNSKGGKLKVLFFWDSRNATTTYSMETLDRLAEKYTKNGVKIFSISSVKKDKWMKKVSKSNKEIFNLYNPEKYDLKLVKDSDVTLCPFFLLVDKNNKIVYRTNFPTILAEQIKKQL